MMEVENQIGKLMVELSKSQVRRHLHGQQSRCIVLQKRVVGKSCGEKF